MMMSGCSRCPSGGIVPWELWLQSTRAPVPPLRLLALPSPCWKLPPFPSGKTQATSSAASSKPGQVTSQDLIPPTTQLLPHLGLAQSRMLKSLGSNPHPSRACDLGKVLSLSVPQFSHLSNGITTTLSLGGCGGVGELMLAKSIEQRRVQYWPA